MKKKMFLSALVVVIAVVLVWAYYPTLTAGSPPLVFHWEGLLPSKRNFRDAGQSINSCAGKPLIPEGLIMRASGFFSGWSCDDVGDPKVIYSLNYSDPENRRYYCRGSEGLRIGIGFQHDELSDLEFIKTWDEHPDFVRAACAYLEKGMAHVRTKESFLYHCDAGRDRTGALTALLAAWLIEESGPLTDHAIDAIECDYERSASLKPYKYGRIKKLLTELRNGKDGVHGFLNQRCGWKSQG